MIVITFDASHADRAKAHPALGYNSIRQRVDRRCWSAQQDGFERRLMIEDNVRCCDDQGVVIVLQIEKPLRQRAGAVIVNVSEAGDARPAATCGKPFLIDQVANQVAHCFWPTGIPAAEISAPRERSRTTRWLPHAHGIGIWSYPKCVCTISGIRSRATPQ